jgi:hypothetical protein
MVDTGMLENFLNQRTAKEMDIITITSEGTFEEIEDTQTKKKRKVLNIEVSNGNRTLVYTPGKKALKIFQNAWGLETKNWLNKKFQVGFVLMQVGVNEVSVIKPIPIA